MDTIDQDDDEARAKKAKFAEHVAKTLSNNNVKAAKKEIKIPIPKIDLGKCMQKPKDEVKNLPDIRSFGVAKAENEKPYESDVFDK